jgi:hypothetical protein
MEENTIDVNYAGFHGPPLCRRSDAACGGGLHEKDLALQDK